MWKDNESCFLDFKIKCFFFLFLRDNVFISKKKINNFIEIVKKEASRKKVNFLFKYVKIYSDNGWMWEDINYTEDNAVDYFIVIKKYER